MLRNLHSSNRAVYRPKHIAEPGINRLSVRLLHGGECSDLQAVRASWSDEHMANSVFLVLFLSNLSHLHPPLAVRPLGQAQSLHARLLHCPSYRGCAVVPFHGAPGPEARVLGCPFDAMDPLHFHIPQHILARLSR